MTTNQTIIFDASGSIDPDGEITSFVWNFGDGTVKQGKTSGHTYARPGVYQVNLTVTDHNEQTYTKTLQVTIDAYAKVTAKLKSSSFPFLYIVLIFTLCSIGIGMMIYRRKKIYNNQSIQSTVNHLKNIHEQIDQLLFEKFGKNR